MSPEVRLCVALLALAGFLAPAAAQDYPARTVKIVVPFGAGGPADIYARYLGQFDKYLRGDIDKWAKVIHTAGIKVQ